MKRSGKTSILLVLALLICFAAGPVYGAFPEKPITLVVHGKAGDGADVLARMFSLAVEKYKILPQPIVVENKPGGSGAVAMAYLAGKGKDPHFISTQSRVHISTPLSGGSPLTIKDFTAIANLDLDDHLLMVSHNSKYKSIKEIAAAAKANPGKVTIGGGFFGGTESMNARLIGKAMGTQVSYISFNSGSEALVALLGGHIDMSSANVSEALELEKAKKIRFLGILTEKRLPNAPNIPTIKEQGIDVVGLGMNRGYIALKGIPEDAVKVLEQAVYKFSQTDLYKKYCEDNLITSGYMGTAKYAKYIEDQTQITETLMREMGLIKKR
jgi:putative tricarboxylic transport membrane protein